MSITSPDSLVIVTEVVKTAQSMADAARTSTEPSAADYSLGAARRLCATARNLLDLSVRSNESTRLLAELDDIEAEVAPTGELTPPSLDSTGGPR